MNVKNISLKDDASYQLIYKDYENHLIFSVLPEDSIQLVIANGDTLINNHRIFQFIPTAMDELAEIRIETLKGLVQEFQLPIEALPQAKLHLGDSYGGEIELAYLLLNPGLFIDFGSNSQLPYIFPITSDLTLIFAKGKSKKLAINGNAFSQKQLKQLQKLSIGDKLTFNNVFSSCDFCLTNQVDATISFTIVE